MKFLIIDDHDLIYRALSSALEQHYPGSEYLQACCIHSARDTIRTASHLDIVILDVLLPLNQEQGFAAEASGLDLIEDLHHFHPTTPIITVSGEDTHQTLALERGAACFLNKGASNINWGDAIKSVLSGTPYPPPDIPGNAATKVELSEQQLKVLRLIQKGYTNKKIADRLGLAESTVKTYVSEILKLLNAKNRNTALLFAQALGLL